MANALESLLDPLIEPVLGLLRDAINAELSEAMVVAGVEPVDAVKTTSPIPFVLTIVSADALPALNCYRVRSRSRQSTFVHVDHTNVLQFVYATPSAGRDLLDPRWAILDRVWRVLLMTLKRGSHAAHQDGADVLEAAGVIRVDLATALKREMFIEQGDFTYPGFLAEIEVTWRDGRALDGGPVWPALSFETKIYVDGASETGEADVVARSLTPTGEEAEDETPFEEEGAL